MVALCLAVFLTGMDQTILATAAPAISNQFHALDDIGGWTNIYLLTLSSFQLLYGKLYSLFSIRVLGSLICTASPNSTTLIFRRALAGRVLIPTKIIPLSRRAIYLGIMSAVFGVAAIVGPFIGGALTDSSTWRWCFGINIPLGAITILIYIFFVETPPEPATSVLTLKEKIRQFDLPGTVILVGGLVCLLLALQWGGSKYPWGSGRVVGLLVVSGTLPLAFVAIQSSSRISKAVFIAGGVYVTVLYIPIWLQVIRNKTALESGVSWHHGYVVFSVVAGVLTSAIGYYNPAMIIGTILAITGSALSTKLTTETSTPRLTGYGLLHGCEAGFGFGQPMYVVQTLLPEADVPIGVTFIALVQNLSDSVFVAIAQCVFQNGLHNEFATFLHGGTDARLIQTGASGVLDLMPLELRSKAVEVYSDAIIHTMYIALAVSCTSIFGAVGIRWQSMKAVKKVETTLDGEKSAEGTVQPDAIETAEDTE
ncbi:major facilitator superfamily domain-containing protein [Clohesyomyces aquaticus]|uniref:Major facilitator superfamily domain-containing protein n=1 Tax=Clohesyomyces aquaticus TaxID=1231657 RepID=A0A1Y1YG77_9PLEO|nr:major facilitator superfamily domain-containing protein [Clohesyomyces aquaticus]